MGAVPNLLPPRDLLQQLQGVERGLRTGRRARLTGVVVAAVQATILLANSSWLKSLVTGDWSAILQRWPLLVSLFALVLGVLVAGWARFWLSESKEPFRYTFAIAPFAPVSGEAEQPLLVALHADVRERLSLRIRRLSRLEDPPADAAPAEGPAAAREGSHLHVTGEYALRCRPPLKRWCVEITPWVRVGGADRPSTLAVPVRFALRCPVDDPPVIEPEEYEQIVERAYFSVATEVYRQIKDDVESKIRLLPNRWFRASALLHEAQDYARSNTLDAYRQARDLYALSLSIYDPGTAPLPRSRLRRPFARARLALLLALRRLRHTSSRVVPRLGRPEVLAARAQIGYANALLDTAVLAPLSGLRARAVYEATPNARSAVERLQALDDSVPGRGACLFDALVALAFSYATLEASDKGRAVLKQARARDPVRAERDARYLFVKAELEDRMLSSIPLYQRAVELQPRFEAAQFQMASLSELVWRGRGALEPSVARSVQDMYDEVLRLNPGNVASWANSAYMWWLLEEPDEARRRLEGGRRFKEIKREAYVAEIDHGLARIAGEAGAFEAAYEHYASAVSARLSNGWAVGSYEDYHFGAISPAMLERFRRYREAVERHHETPDANERRRTTPRVRDCVLSFALYDFAQACLFYFYRTHDFTVLEEGYAACERACALDDQFVLPAFLMYRLELERQDFVYSDLRPERHLDVVEALEPGWPEASLSLMAWHADQAGKARKEQARLNREASDRDTEIKQLKELQAAVKPGTGFGTPSTVGAGDDGDPRGRPAGLARLEQEAADLRAAAREQGQLAEDRERRARDLPETLLPHRWLWDERTHEFAWHVVTDRDAKRELLWERSLDRFHVDALIGWCRARSTPPRPDPSLDALLDLIELRFVPGDLALLQLRRERAALAPQPLPGRRFRRRPPRPGPRPEDYARRIDAIIDGELTRWRSSFSALRGLDPASDTAVRRFKEAARQRDLSPYLYHWLGQRLLERWKFGGHDPGVREAALIACGAAQGVREPAVIMELADALIALRADEATALKLYDQAAADATEPDLLWELAARLERPDLADRVPALLESARRADAARTPHRRAPEQYHRAIARARFAIGRPADARLNLDAIPLAGGELGPRWRAALALEMAGRELRDHTTHLRLRDWLGAAQARALARGAEDAADDAADAALDLSQTHWSGAADRELAPDEEFQRRSPFALPIVLEADDGFFPEQDQTRGVRWMIDTGIPEMRDEIRRQSGFGVPGVRIRGKAQLAGRRYRILVLEVPVADGEVPADERDPYRFMVARLLDAVRCRVSWFVNVQTVEAPLGGAERPVAERTGLVRLLRALAEDGVPIDDIDAIAAQRGPQVSDDVVAERLRADRRDRLWGRELPPVEVSEDLEARLAEFAPLPAGFEDLAAENERLLALRDELGELIPAEPVALVVRSRDVRPVVRRLVALDRPDVPVLSADELPQRASRLVPFAGGRRS